MSADASTGIPLVGGQDVRTDVSESPSATGAPVCHSGCVTSARGCAGAALILVQCPDPFIIIIVIKSPLGISEMS